MVQRRKLILYVRQLNYNAMSRLLEANVRVTAGTGIRTDNNTNSGISVSQWSFISGNRSHGRFTVSSSRKRILNQEECEDISLFPPTLQSLIPIVDNNVESGIIIDFQTAQLTLKSAHLQALETSIASDPDVQLIFGSKSMQASTIESTEHRTWVHLVGRSHDIQYWKTEDQRTCIQDLDRDYSPGELNPSEEWIVPLFEPVRLMYMTQPFALQVCIIFNSFFLLLLMHYFLYI
jgi:hypothetical protein